MLRRPPAPDGAARSTPSRTRSPGSIMRSPRRRRAAYRPAAHARAAAITRVSREPTMISVAMSARAASASSSVDDVDALVRPPDGAAEHDRRRRRQMPAQPLDRGSRIATAAPATPDCRARCTKPAPAAASSRRSISSHGLRLSDSDSAQKSWPSGAPIRAATASIAVMPGHDGDIERAPAFRPGFDLLADRRRHGEDAGIAAGDDRDARALAPRDASAAAARAPSSRLSDAWRL